MPSYKYKTSKGVEKWYCAFYIRNFSGESKKIKKSGFGRKKDAQEYEREYLNKFSGSPEITFKALCALYMEDLAMRAKPRTIRQRQGLIDRELIPTFGDLPIKDITPALVRKWQNDLIARGLKPTTLSATHAVLSAVLNWAMKYQGLKDNAARVAGAIGKQNADEMNIISVQDFQKYIDAENIEPYRVFFSVLFWTGMRKGEAMALTWDDVDFENTTIKVNKSYAKIKGVEYVGTPKTEKSNRVISIHSGLLEMLKELKVKQYKAKGNERIFTKSEAAYQLRLTTMLKRLGIRHIRIHDLRHSHASMLLSAGVDVVSVSRRLGHEKVSTTLNTYAHLMPNSDVAIVEKINSTLLVQK